MKKPDSITKNDWLLLQKKYRNLESVIKKLEKNYPVQYLIGHVEFYGLKLFVNESVLIPRFETEYLVEKTLEYINKLNLEEKSVLDIGTGSGCIGIALKNQIPSLSITAIDISRKALRIAKRNAKYHKTKINFINKSLFKYNLINKYDILISNPPYIKKGEQIDPQTLYEPDIAIYTGKDGLKYYEQIFNIAKKSLNKKHLIALEIGENQATILKKLAKDYFPNDKIIIEKDLPGKNRYLFSYSE